MSYLREEGIKSWWLCAHCREREYDFLDEDGRQLCYKCYYRLLKRGLKRENWKSRLIQKRNKEKIKRKETRQFYEILNNSGLLKDYQIGFAILDYLVV